MLTNSEFIDYQPLIIMMAEKMNPNRWSFVTIELKSHNQNNNMMDRNKKTHKKFAQKYQT